MKSLNKFFDKENFANFLSIKKQKARSHQHQTSGIQLYEEKVRFFDNILFPVLIAIVIWSYLSFFSVVLFSG